MIFKYFYVRIFLDSFDENLFNFPSRQVGSVKYPSVRVTSFFSEIKVFFSSIFPFGKLNSPGKQLFYSIRPVFDNELDDVSVTNAGTGHERVFYVIIETVFCIPDGCDSSLCHVGTRFRDIPLRYDIYVSKLSRFQSETETCHAASDDKKR